MNAIAIQYAIVQVEFILISIVGIKYKCIFSFELKKESSIETKIIEYDSLFEPIKETIVDYSELNEGFLHNPFEKEYDYKISKDCLFVVIEDKYENDIDRRVIWREDIKTKTSVILYRTDDYYYSNIINFLREQGAYF